VESSIQPFDFARIFLGEEPLWFLLEVAFRTAFMYLYTIALVRTMGNRTLGQLSMVEFLLVVAIGSAVGDPMFYADVPLVHGMVVVTIVVGVNRLIVAIVNRSEKAEIVFDGEPSCVVRGGLLLPDAITSANLNREKVFLMLRLQGIRSLGQVEHAFLEQGGQLSVFPYGPDEVVPGLHVIPPWDLEQPDRYAQGDAPPRDCVLGCERCGYVLPQTTQPLPCCPNCDHDTWADAVSFDTDAAESR
jgi:uncharacterized membrane protein YcaP (DUF421 family)